MSGKQTIHGLRKQWPVVTFMALAVVGYALGSWVFAGSPDWLPLRVGARVVAIVCGLALLCLVPGGLIAFRTLPNGPNGLVTFLIHAFTANLIFHILASRAIIAVGYDVGQWNYAAVTAGAALICLGWAWPRFSKVSVKYDLNCCPWLVALATSAIIAFAVLLRPPYFVDEERYLNETAYARFAAVEFPETSSDLVCTTEGLSALEANQYRLERPTAILTFRPVTEGHMPITPLLLLQNEEAREVTVSLRLDGKELATTPVPPRYDRSRHSRNAPTAHALIAIGAGAAPATKEARFELTVTGHDGSEAPRLLVFDFTSLSRRDFARRLRETFFIGDLGDIRETLDWARSFRNHLVQYSRVNPHDSSDDGGGCYCSISDEPPLHHLVCMIAMTLFGDSIASISYLYLAELALIFWLTLAIVSMRNESSIGVFLLPVTAVVCAYTVFVRLGLEANAPDTLFCVLLLGMVYALLGERHRLMCVLIGLSYLTHAPTIPVVGMLLLAYGVVYRRRDTWALGLEAAVVICAVTALWAGSILIVAGPLHVFYTGQGNFASSGRMDLVGSIVLKGELGNIRYLLANARTFSGVVMLGSCLLPAFVLLRKDREAWFCLLTFVLYHVAICMLRFQRAHHAGPGIFLVALAMVRALTQVNDRWARRVVATLAVLGAALALAISLQFGADYTGALDERPLELLSSPWYRAPYHRQLAEWRIEEGDVSAAAAALEKAWITTNHMTTNRSKLTSEFLIAQFRAHRNRAEQHEREGKRERAAREHSKAAQIRLFLGKEYQLAPDR